MISNVRYPSLLTKCSLSRQHWLTMLTWMTVLALFAVAIWMRLRSLDVPFDRDSYDEGVYWQTLRSMSAGASLYQQIFYSQPPFFLLSVYLFYALLGQTIWAARLSVAVISLFGLLGALLLGRALAGRLGMLLALLLLVINPLYLTESQILQADAPSTALCLREKWGTQDEDGWNHANRLHGRLSLSRNRQPRPPCWNSTTPTRIRRPPSTGSSPGRAGGAGARRSWCGS